MIGTTLSHYSILEKIGTGGMGEVYRAKDGKLGRDVAIKVLPAEVAGDAERLSRFELEARATGSMNHPNLVTLYELGTENGMPYLVMELLEGETLRDRLGDTKAASSSGSGTAGTPPSGSAILDSGIPPRKAIEYAIQIAQGLAAAHDQGIAHRDLKPDNVFITRAGRAKILDFGLAKLTAPVTDDATIAGGGHDDTKPGTVLGTVGYMSPEQVRGEEVDHRSDIFSLGVIMFEMLTGRRAFHAASSIETMNAILRDDPSGLGSDPSRVSPAVDRIMRRCLEKDREHRFQSGHDLAYALEAVHDTSGGTTSVAAERDVRRPAIPLTVAGLAVLAIGVLAFFLGRSSAPAPAEAPVTAAGAGAPTLLPLTFEPGIESGPSLSPNGRSFLFVSNRDGDRDIYLQRVRGENAINLTVDSPAHDVYPAFSPDGERIAFSVFPLARGESDGIFVMGATGESRRRLTEFGAHPAWSPDGESLAFADDGVTDPRSRPSVSALWRVDVATGETKKISDGDAVQPSWSPNGKWIAYWGLPKSTGRRVLYTIPADGGEAFALTDDDHFNWCPVWSPDGSSLYFSSSRSGSMDIWRLPMDPGTGRTTGPPAPVTTSPDWIAHPSVSRDGTRMVFASERSTTSLFRYPFDVAGDAVRAAPEILLETARDLWELDVSPNGEWLALKAADPYEDLFVCRVDGTGMRRLTHDAYKDRGPAWGPRSEVIHFFSDRSGRYECWSIRRDGSGLTQVTELEGRSVNSPAPSPDGKTILVHTTRGAPWVGSVDLSQELPVREVDWFPAIDSTRAFLGGPWSPDGTRVVGPDDQFESVWIYSVRDQTYEKVPGRAFQPGWVTDDLLLAYEADTFRVLDLRTGEKRTVLDTGQPEHAWRWELSSDTKWLYGLGDEQEGDIWMLEAAEGARF